MSGVYLSFLGTNDYLPCNYFIKDLVNTENVRFVQEATIGFCCRDWSSDDRIFIFATEGAKKKNWLSDGHVDVKSGEVIECEGLKQRVEYLKIRVPVQKIEIPEGKSEQEIWEIFRIVYDVLNEGDDVIFDITHAFRSIPMLAIVVLNYAKVLKKISLRGIYYGAFEVLGSIPEAKKIPLEERNVPVLDLTAFDQLLDWSTGIDRFIETGNAELISHLAQRGIKPILKATKGRDESAAAIRKISQELQRFTEVLAVCRGPEIVQVASDLKNEVEKPEKLDLLPPFIPLFDKIKEQMKPFDNDTVYSGIQAAKWCRNHNLLQQSYTILQETLITYLVIQSGKDLDKLDYRTIVNQAVNIVNRNRPEDEWKEPAASNKELTLEFINFFRENSGLAEMLRNLTAYRNDLNHAGYNPNPMNVTKFEDKLSELLRNVEGYLSKSKAELN